MAIEVRVEDLARQAQLPGSEPWELISLSRARELLETKKEKEGPGGADGGADGSKTKKTATQG